MTDKTADHYRDAGVDLDAAQKTIASITNVVRETRTPGVMNDIGGFGAMFDLGAAGFGNETVLVAATDGVGTKLKIAFDTNDHSTVGIDLVAMCVNDIVVSGAKPLFFLDYFGTGKLEPSQATDVIKGIAEGCKRAGCALVGGETAELPGFYDAGEYDLAGFCVGAVNKKAIVDTANVSEGDAVWGIPSTGFHSNGYSLIRKIVGDAGLDWQTPFEATTIGAALLEPTRIYVQEVLALSSAGHLNAAAHITGGGFYENLPRVLPDGLGVRINTTAWSPPSIIDYICSLGNIPSHEQYRVFNMGLGMVVVSGSTYDVQSIVADAIRIGSVTSDAKIQLDGLE